MKKSKISIDRANNSFNNFRSDDTTLALDAESSSSHSHTDYTNHEAVILETPKELKTTNFLRENVQPWPDLLLLGLGSILISSLLGVCFGWYGIIQLNFTAVFYISILLTILLGSLFYKIGLSNFPVFFVVSSITSIFTVTIGHLYVFYRFYDLFHSSKIKNKTLIWSYIVSTVAPTGETLTARRYTDWIIIFLFSLVILIFGLITPFLVCLFYAKHDSD
jgi:hypothetical protein